MGRKNVVKYGVVLYQDTDNIGDDIQTYAAYQFLPRVDYVIDRERLSSFVPEHDQEVVKVIMNGWYNHHKYSFLPSPYIDPLLISMHFSSNDLILNPGHKFLEGYSRDALMKYAPIGCRDLNTQKVLNSLGYDTYFSGCATLTLDTIGKKEMKDYICAVDMKPEIVAHLREVMGCEIKEISHWLIEFSSSDLSYEEKQKEIHEYTMKSYDERAKLVSSHASLSFEERMKKVEELLQIYQNAKLVITDRIHVALPCIALKTPVLLIYYEHNADRIATFKEYIVHCTEEEFFTYNKEKLEQIENKNKYKEIRKNIKAKIKSFLEKESALTFEELPSVQFYRTDVVKRFDANNSLFIDKIDSLKEDVLVLQDDCERLRKRCLNLKKHKMK